MLYSSLLRRVEINVSLFHVCVATFSMVIISCRREGAACLAFSLFRNVYGRTPEDRGNIAVKIMQVAVLKR